MYILQESLFSFEELQILESKEKLPIFFSALDLRPYAKQLKSSSPQGAEGHSKEGILRALIAAPLEGIDTFTSLHNRLKNDLRFRYQCGLDISRPAPSISTLSRVFSSLTKTGLVKRIFQDLVQLAQEEGVIDGKHQVSTVPPLMLTKRSSLRSEVNKQATPIGGQSLIPSVIKLLGLAIRCIFPLTPKVNYQWRLK